jgi:protein arginine kinase
VPNGVPEEPWKHLVLRSMTAPAWLSVDAPESDVVLSSRVRVMRNLSGFKFVHKASERELREVMDRVFLAAGSCSLDLETFKNLTNVERDYLVGCRLVSPDFEWTLPGRAVMVDKSRCLAVMVNEEDHVRFQALTAGLSFLNANQIASNCVAAFGQKLDYAYSPTFGHLSASHINLGAGKRISAMFHLIGLAHARRLPSVITALGARHISVRGLFGESSRAIGAFAQVSVLSGNLEEFRGACEYLIREERKARSELGWDRLSQRANQAREFALGSRTVSLADALRVLAWIRWAATTQVPGFHLKPRDIDGALADLEIRGSFEEETASRKRAESLRMVVGV